MLLLEKVSDVGTDDRCCVYVGPKLLKHITLMSIEGPRNLPDFYLRHR
jgi:hypothetical protein